MFWNNVLFYVWYDHYGPANLGNRLMKPLVKILDFGFQKALSFYFRVEKFPPEFLRIAFVV